MKTQRVKSLLLLPVLLAVSRPAFPEPGVSSSEIKIGSCLALSGRAERLGKDLRLGAQAYFDDLNAHGGVNGRKIRWIVHDDASDPREALNCFQQLVSEDVFAMNTVVGLQSAAKYIPLAENHGLPLIGVFSGDGFVYEPLHPHVFAIRASHKDEMQEQIDNMWNILGYRRIAVAYQSDAFGVSVLEDAKQALKKYNAAPAATPSFLHTDSEFKTVVDALKKSGAEAVILIGSPQPLAGIVQAARSAGWSGLCTTVSFVDIGAFIAAAGDAAEGVVFTEVVPPPSKELPTTVLYRKLLSRFSSGATPSMIGLEGFVNAMVLTEGIRRAGKDLTRDGLVSALESINDFDTGLGPQLHLNYGRDSHKGFDRVYYTVIQHGQPVVFFRWKDLLSQTASAR